MKTCSVSQCDLPIKCRGYCNKHYLKWWKRGDPEARPLRRANGMGWISVQGYQMHTRNGNDVYEHIWVWEQKFGRVPKGFVVHHKDENKLNNAIENLELQDKSSHLRHHKTLWWQRPNLGRFLKQQGRDDYYYFLVNDAD